VQRVFIGIPVDKRAQQQIDELLNPLKSSIQAVRWVPVQNRHLTLAFLGNRPASVIEKLTRSMDQAYQQETFFETGPANLKRFPGPSGNIIALVFKVDARLARLFQVTQEYLLGYDFDFKRTRFRPHITLGRMGTSPRLIKDINQQTDIKLQIGRIAFYQSTLTPSGSVYLALKETGLGNAG
jgi:2'-5' RNA ligase